MIERRKRLVCEGWQCIYMEQFPRCALDFSPFGRGEGFWFRVKSLEVL